MTETNRHYTNLVRRKKRSHFASCGYQDRFDPFALSQSPRIRALYQDVFSQLDRAQNLDRLLDVGCGTGIYFEQLAPHAGQIDAIDFSPEMVEVAQRFCRERNLAHVRPQVGDAQKLPWEDHVFDAVVAMDVLHHVPDVAAAVAEAARVLKTGGVFLVFEPNILNPLMLLAHLIPREERKALRRNSPKQLAHLLQAHFQPVQWRGVCELVTQSGGLKHIALDTYLAACRRAPQKWWPRQLWAGIKTA